MSAEVSGGAETPDANGGQTAPAAVPCRSGWTGHHDRRAGKSEGKVGGRSGGSQRTWPVLSLRYLGSAAEAADASEASEAPRASRSRSMAKRREWRPPVGCPGSPAGTDCTARTTTAYYGE